MGDESKSVSMGVLVPTKSRYGLVEFLWYPNKKAKRILGIFLTEDRNNTIQVEVA